MSSIAKCVLAIALVLSASLAASAATKTRVTQSGLAAAQAAAQPTAYDVIPGYGKDGGRVAVPNPNR
jgi:hypothetical protein